MNFETLREITGAVTIKGLPAAQSIDLVSLLKVGSTADISDNPALVITTNRCMKFDYVGARQIRKAPERPMICSATSPCEVEALGCSINKTTVDCGCRGIRGELGPGALVFPGDTQHVSLAGNYITLMVKDSLVISGLISVDFEDNPLRYVHKDALASCLKLSTVKQTAVDINCPLKTIPSRLQVVSSCSANNCTFFTACACQTGSWCDDSTVRVCTKGTSSRSPYEEPCTKCSPGRFGELSGMATCDLCPVGKSNNASGSTSQDNCTWCEAGTYCFYPGQAAPLKCPPGQYSDEAEGNFQCTPCKEGFYSSGLGSTECAKCPDDRPSSSQGAASESACVRRTVSCAAGKYCNNSGTYDCPKDTTTGANGGASEKDCASW